MHMLIITSLVLVIYVVDSTYYCPRMQNNPRCNCRETSSSVEMTCVVNNSNQLYTISSSSYAQHLTQLSILLDGISNLPSSALGFQNLISLGISGNNLVSIDNNAFIGLEENLSYLYLDRSKLQNVPVAAITRLLKLHTLNVRWNQIGSLNTSIRSMPLQELVVSHNMISNIAKGIFPSTLGSLDLRNNRLHSLNGSLTGNLLRLRKLNFSNNSIDTLNRELYDTPRLIHLIADWNLIGNIDDGSLQYLSQLQLLNLSHNRIYQVVNGLNGLHKLLELDLSYNGLTHLNVASLNDLTALYRLILSHNDISYLEEGLFDCLTSLRILDISYNRLQELGFLTPPQELSDLSTDESLEQGMTNCTFRDYSKLQILSVLGNELNCGDATNQTIRYLQSKEISLDGDPCTIDI